MPRRPTFTPDEVATIRTEFENHATIPELVAKYGVSQNTIRDVLRGAGAYAGLANGAVLPPAEKRNKLDMSRVYNLLADRERGSTAPELAAEYGLSVSSVHRVLSRSGRYSALLTADDVARARMDYYVFGAGGAAEFALATNPYVASLPYDTAGWTKEQTEEAIADYIATHWEADHERMFPDYYAPAVETIDRDELVARLTAERDKYRARVAVLEREAVTREDAARYLAEAMLERVMSEGLRTLTGQEV